LSHQLVRVRHAEKEVFDSVIVVTDRRILDDQLQKTVRQFMQVRATVGHAQRSGDLRKFIAEGKKIIITTVQKFPFILNELEGEGTGKNFAIVIDEAHSSQGGKTASAMSKALGEAQASSGPRPENESEGSTKPD
jgi:type I restriction enzyme R subunit